MSARPVLGGAAPVRSGCSGPARPSGPRGRPRSTGPISFRFGRPGRIRREAANTRAHRGGPRRRRDERCGRADQSALSGPGGGPPGYGRLRRTRRRRVPAHPLARRRRPGRPARRRRRLARRPPLGARHAPQETWPHRPPGAKNSSLKRTATNKQGSSTSSAVSDVFGATANSSRTSLRTMSASMLCGEVTYSPRPRRKPLVCGAHPSLLANSWTRTNCHLPRGLPARRR
jgi:hypothetical protein